MYTTLRRQDFVNRLKELEKDSSLSDKSSIELRNLYYTLNLEYIQYCEENSSTVYFPSSRHDEKFQRLIANNAKEDALKIVHARIAEIIKSISPK